jgi:hypothetical protein
LKMGNGSIHAILQMWGKPKWKRSPTKLGFRFIYHRKPWRNTQK